MANRPGEFSIAIQQQALMRQKNRCASCGTRVFGLGNTARAMHRFGEGVQAHHIRHIKAGGTGQADNCVVVCQSCHYSVHEGGNYRHGTVIGQRGDFPYFKG